MVRTREYILFDISEYKKRIEGINKEIEILERKKAKFNNKLKEKKRLLE